MNRFVTGDGAPRTPERAEMLARVDPTLDRPVILFQDVIEILYGAVLARLDRVEVQPWSLTGQHHRRCKDGLFGSRVGIEALPFGTAWFPFTPSTRLC